MVVVRVREKVEFLVRGVCGPPWKSDRELEDERAAVVGVDMEVATDEGIDTAILRLDGEGCNGGEFERALDRPEAESTDADPDAELDPVKDGRRMEREDREFARDLGELGTSLCERA